MTDKLHAPSISTRVSSTAVIIAVSAFFTVTGMCQSGNRIVGYYASWNSNSLPYDKVEYSNLTDIIVSFGTPDSDGTITYDTGIPFSQLVAEAHLAGTKVLISLGGAGSGQSFSVATTDSTHRAKLISSVVSFLQNNQYDGVDIDWETPATSAETSQLTSLIQEMRARFAETDTSWLITMAIPATGYGGQNFDFAHLVNYVDWFNVMCYDFVGSWAAYTGHNSPLYEAPDDPNQAGSDSNAVLYWNSRVSRGTAFPGNKIVLGIPFYAVQFDAPGLYRKLTNTTTSNPYYPDVMNDLASGWTYNWDDISKVPFLLNSDTSQFITFEDTNSVKLKVEYAIRHKLGGVMIWELSQDLYQGRQPLLETIARAMKNLTDIPSEQLIASDYRLYDNFPNPFNPSTVIRFSIPQSGYVKIDVYNVLGQRVKTLVDGWMRSGVHEVGFDPFNLSSGVYFYTMTTGGIEKSKKMLFLK